ncbi:ester cyclase [Myxococcota bacterium]|nr:ester cyclase [Myxococcota bacterium]
MGARENKELIRRLYAEGFPGAPEGLDRYFARGYVDHALWGDLPGLKSALKALKTAYLSVEWAVDDLIAEGDKVAARATMKVPGALGTYKAITSTTIFRFDASGRIAETWGHGDPIR